MSNSAERNGGATLFLTTLTFTRLPVTSRPLLIESILRLDADMGGVDRVEGMLGIDEGGPPAALLRLGDDVQGEGRLSGRLRPVDLDHPTPRDAAHTEREIEGHGPGGDHVDVALRRRL